MSTSPMRAGVIASAEMPSSNRSACTPGTISSSGVLLEFGGETEPLREHRSKVGVHPDDHGGVAGKDLVGRQAGGRGDHEPPVGGDVLRHPGAADLVRRAAGRAGPGG